MIRLPEVELSPPAVAQLAKLQQQIDALPQFADRVAAAKQKWASKSTDKSPFQEILRLLNTMCFGARRCHYCHDSRANQIEHIKPKDMYPEVAFVWENYLYACGPCNGPKNNQFAVFSKKTGKIIEVTRQRNAPVVPPEPGDPVFLNPRQDDPLEFMELDLLGTFFFLPRGQKRSRKYKSALYTITVLRLNDDEVLTIARAGAFGEYRVRLREYVAEKKSKASPDRLSHLISGITNNRHRAVWLEMKRLRKQIPELAALFDQCRKHWPGDISVAISDNIIR